MTQPTNVAQRKWKAKNPNYYAAYYEKHKEKYRARSRAWRLANPDKVSASNKKHGRGARLKYRYGLTEEDYNRILAAQGGRCAVPTCRSPNPGGNLKHFHIDHDYVTGKVRGLLCLRCNVILHRFRDNKKFLLGLIEYLERDNKQNIQGELLDLFEVATQELTI